MKAINLFKIDDKSSFQLPKGFVTRDGKVRIDGHVKQLQYTLSAGDEASKLDTFFLNENIDDDSEFTKL